MSEPSLPDPPHVASINPQMMTSAELRSGLESLFEWLQTAEALPENELKRQVGDRALQQVRDAANSLLLEQRDRHSDELAPRGG